MKQFLPIIAVFAMLLAACGGGAEEGIGTEIVKNPETAAEVDPSNPDNIPMPELEWTNNIYEFGKVTQGEKVIHQFKFKNTGNADLIIASAKGSCGCTVPHWPKEPIAPGQEGEMKVVFDSEGKTGKQNKKVTVVANTYPATSQVAIKGEVISPRTENN